MYLKELTINGFKSFAKKSDLEFSAPITAIVGPNGSGKSNVAESFRFVLGEQSVKSLRGKRGEDLIWGGSEGVSRGNRASVEILLDNSKRVFALDFDTIKIERVVHRDGQNEYLINDSAVRLKDVQELLAAANIGSTGHHIISQGEADRILTASARERREMIEDALGLKVYQYKKAEAQKKLEKTKENIAQVESLRREHAPHLRYLKKQVERVEKSLAVQNELKTLYATYLKREDVYLAFHNDRLVAARREPERALQALQDQLVAAKTALRQAEMQKDTTAVLQAEEVLAAARKERAVLLRNLGAVEGEVTYIMRKLAQAEATPVHEKPSLISLSTVEELVATLGNEIEKAVMRDEPAILKRALQDVLHSLRAFLQKTEPEVVANDTRGLQAELASTQNKQAQLAQEYETAGQREVAAQSEYERLRSAIEAEASESRAAERTVFELVGKVRQLETEVEVIDRESAVVERDRDEFKRELQEAVALIQSAAAHYFSHEIVENGVVVTNEAIAAEDRGVQHQRRRELEKLKIRLEELGIGATDDVLAEYNNAVERDAFLEREVGDLTTSVANLEGLITELDGQLHERFVAGIEKIATEFNRFFVLMFGGGSAALKRVKPKIKTVGEDGVEVESEGEETAEGVELDISLPNKRVKGLEMLSGGERALTSIALIFAMSQVHPPLFIILDETDAALDEANSRRYGDMITALAQKSQLILITHNRETMSRAGILYGVTMGSDGVSKLLSVKFDEAVVVAK
jgi:chromosome segregation ATPase